MDAPSWLVAIALAAAGVGLTAGGVLHPHVAETTTDQKLDVASNALWVASHWMLTVAQAGAVVSLLLAATAAQPLILAGLVRAGLFTVTFGLSVGAVGTAIASTGLRTAAALPDAALFRVMADVDVGTGWTCLVLASAGGTIVGVGVARAASGRGSRAFGWTTAIGSAALLVSALLVPPLHPATHQYLLRAGAVGLGALLLWAGAGWRRLSRARRKPGP